MKLAIRTVLCILFLFPLSLMAQEFGKASYYDQTFQGAKTASGELYDGNAYTAAHKLHTFGTRIRVTRQDNGKSIVVRVNDRGPHIKGRIVDLSYAAAKALDMIRDGVINVRVDVISRGSESPAVVERPTEASTPPTRQSTQPAPNRSSNTPPVTNTASSVENQNQENRSSTSPATGRNVNLISTGTPTTSTTTAKGAEKPKSQLPVTKNSSNDYGDRLLTKPYEKFGLYEIKILQVNKAGFGVQISSLSSYENAMKYLSELQAKKVSNALLNIEPKANGAEAFKIIIGPYESRDAAKKEAKRLQKLVKVKGFVVDLSTIGL